jgi:hypothetical protein
MAITKLDPWTIWLGGPKTEINDLAAHLAITPGMLVQRYVPSGTINRLRPHSTASANTPKLIAVEHSMANKSVNDDYAVGDLVEAIACVTGTSVWAWIPSGANIAFGALLESNGDGRLKAGSTQPLFSALETINNSGGLNAPARIRVEAL